METLARVRCGTTSPGMTDNFIYEQYAKHCGPSSDRDLCRYMFAVVNRI